MSDQFRLVFTGELVEGHHPAVVKQRLAAVLKLDDQRVETLFAGKPVVVKKAADEKTAARFQAVFNKAGARLRVLPLDGGAPDTSQQNEPAQASEPTELELLPLGTDVLTEAERTQPVESDIDTSHLSVQGATFVVDELQEPIGVPDVDHLTLAELGARLGVDTAEVVVAEIDVTFTLAEVGAIIGKLDADPVTRAVDVDAVDFELAELGADLGTRDEDPSPAPPDTSHLKLQDE